MVLEARTRVRLADVAPLAFTGVLVVVTSYAGIVLLPDVAIHSANSAEPQHAGLWRGLFAHKNIAGPVMSCFCSHNSSSAICHSSLPRSGVSRPFGSASRCSTCRATSSRAATTSRRRRRAPPR